MPNAGRGQLSLRVRRIGFNEFSGVAEQGATGDIEIRLSRAPRQLGTVTITATGDSPLVRSGFYDRLEQAQRGAFVAEFITPEEIRERNASQVAQLLQGRRFVTISSSKGARPRLIAYGRNGCEMSILVDKQRINANSTDPDGSVAIDDLVSGRSVVAIEVYASNANAPAELVPLTGAGSCGIIAIWTGAP